VCADNARRRGGVSSVLEADARRWIEVLHASHTRLVAFVARLSDADLRRQSYATDWAVAQVLSHLGSQAEIFTTFLDAGLAGRPTPGNDTFPPVWAAWNERDPDAQAHDSLVATGVFIDKLRALDDAALSRPVTPFGMNLTIGELPRLRVGEHALHSWDIMVAFDPSATVADDAVALLIDQIPALVARTGKPQGRTFAVRVRTTAPAYDYVLAVGDRVELRPDADEVVDATVEMSAEALLRLAYGRLDAGHTPETTKVVEGRDRVGLDDLRSIFAGL
jgi:uncharacterized protein (TIGR03083 family)